MEVYTILLSLQSECDVITLTRLLQKQFDHLYKQFHLMKWEQLSAEKIACFIDYSTQSKLQFVEQRQSILDKIAAVIADFILCYKEKTLLCSLIKKKTKFEIDECEKITDYCYQLLNDPEQLLASEVKRRRKEKIIHALRTYLAENMKLNIEGFIRFRLHHYLLELHEVMDCAINEYMLDCQYQEFIGLLKYFVFIQDSKIPLAHLMHKGNHEFLLLDEILQPVEPKFVPRGMIVEMINGDMEMEDMIVSTLIHVSPQQIIIHTREPNCQVIKTIQQIFELRVYICVSCNACHPMIDREDVKSKDFYT